MRAKGRASIQKNLLWKIVSKGMIHTVSNFRDVKLYLKSCHKAFLKQKGEELIIVKAIIPKGTKYVKGGTLYCLDGVKFATGYASKKIILDEEPLKIIARLAEKLEDQSSI